MAESRRAVLVVATATIAVLLPLFTHDGEDSFPLSTYPMFSGPKEAVVDTDLVLGVDGSGDDLRLSPEEIAGTDEVIVAGGTVRAAVSSGGAAQLCEEVAGRVDPGEVVAIQVVTDRLDAVAWYEGDRSPLDRTVHHRCDVP